MNASVQKARPLNRVGAWLRRFTGRDGVALETELRSYEVFLKVSTVVVIGTWFVMTLLGRFPLVAHVFSALWVGLQLFVHWRRRHPLPRSRGDDEL